MPNDATPHGVAYNMMLFIAWSEGKNINTMGENTNAPNRNWILSTYAQCLETINDPERVEEYLEHVPPE